MCMCMRMFFYGVEADLTDIEREMCVVPEGRGDPHDEGKVIGPQETAAQRLNETLPRERGFRWAL
jgi:hypothetical protein